MNSEEKKFLRERRFYISSWSLAKMEVSSDLLLTETSFDGQLFQAHDKEVETSRRAV